MKRGYGRAPSDQGATACAHGRETWRIANEHRPALGRLQSGHHDQREPLQVSDLPSEESGRRIGRPFLVLFTARSGSTALYGNIAAHPDVEMRPEVFGGTYLPGKVEQSDDNRVAFLKRYWKPFHKEIAGTPPKGFKLQITRDNAQFSDLGRLVKVLRKYDPAIVVLKRKNMLKQVVSSLNARRLKSVVGETVRHNAHITSNEAQARDVMRRNAMTVDLDEVSTMLGKLEQTYGMLDALAEKFDEPILRITYEEYLADRDATVCRVLEHVGADPGRWQPADAYLKITSDDLSESVANYDELKLFLRGTSYEEMT